MAAANGAADAITQMIARIIPVGLDPRFADQRFGDTWCEASASESSSA